MGMGPHEQNGGFGKGPLEMRVADLLARGLQVLARRVLRTLAQATIRGQGLPPGEAVHVMDVVAQHETEACAHTRHGVSQVQSVGIVWLRGGEEGECQSTEQLILIREQGQVALAGLGHSGSGKALGAPRAVGLGGDVLANRGHVLLPMRLLPMGQQRSALAPQVGAATEEVPRRAQGGRRDRGLWEQAATQPGRDLVGSELVVFGLAAMHGFHREGMPQNAGDPFCSPQVSEPIPGEETLDGHAQAVTRRGDGLEERCRSGWHMTVQQHCARVVHDTAIHAPGLQVDTAVKGVLMGVEAPVRSPL